MQLSILRRSRRILSVLLILTLLMSITGCNSDVSEEMIQGDYRTYYEIFVYSFYDSDGDGTGDLQGIIEKLDYLNDGDPSTQDDLGISGIWLMPIMPSPTYHKYDVTDYYSIDPKYGTLEDMQALVEACHERGIRIIIDLVINHSSARHPWFVEACSYLKDLPEGETPDPSVCPYVEYYHFYPSEDKPSSSYRIGNSDWFYEAMFWDQMPDFNLDSPALRAEIEEITAYWLNLGVDGFRLDAAKEFFSGSPAKNIEVLSWFQTYAETINPEVYIVAEVWENLANITNYYSSGVDSIFHFPMSQHDGRIARWVTGKSACSGIAEAMIQIDTDFSAQNEDYIDAPFITNHDTTRASNAFVSNESHIKMAAGILLTLGGNPFIYYGEEIGMRSSGSKDENKRLPMYWSATDTTGITTKAPNADANIESKFAPVDVQLADPDSILSYYRTGIHLRNTYPAIARGSVTSYPDLGSDTLCFLSKTYEESTIYIAYCTGEVSETIDLSATMTGKGDRYKLVGSLVASSGSSASSDSDAGAGAPVVTLDDNILTLPPYSIAFLTLK